MKKAQKIALITFVVLACTVPLAAWYVYTSVPFVKFTPIYLSESQKLQIEDTPLTEAQADRIQEVLERYSEVVRRSDSTTILITWQLSRNQELIWNYTTKSWIED